MLEQASLARLQLEYVDLLFCHRPDTTTPIEETVRAMNWIIEHGYAFYWCAVAPKPAQKISLVLGSANALKSVPAWAHLVSDLNMV